MARTIQVQYFGLILICVAFIYLDLKLEEKCSSRCDGNISSFRRLNLVQNKNSKVDYEKEIEQLIKVKVDQHDQRLIQLIRDYYIIPPSEEPYNLVNPNATDYSLGQTPFIDNRLNFKENGFYVECGGFDGETSSNTLFLEKTRHWNGILIEPDPHHFKVLKTKHRKAFLLNACLNTDSHPTKKTFNMGDQRSRVAENKEQLQWIQGQGLKSSRVTVLCFPLYSILRAMGQLNVDFFSLDIEGDELPVLKTIPWNKVNITMLTVEFKHGKAGSKGLGSYLLDQGYDYLNTIHEDAIFKRKYIR